MSLNFAIKDVNTQRHTLTNSKGRLSHRKRMPFTLQKDTFSKAKGHLLETCRQPLTTESKQSQNTTDYQLPWLKAKEPYCYFSATKA